MAALHVVLDNASRKPLRSNCEILAAEKRTASFAGLRSCLLHFWDPTTSSFQLTGVGHLHFWPPGLKLQVLPCLNALSPHPLRFSALGKLLLYSKESSMTHSPGSADGRPGQVDMDGDSGLDPTSPCTDGQEQHSAWWVRSEPAATVCPEPKAPQGQLATFGSTLGAAEPREHNGLQR